MIAMSAVPGNRTRVNAGTGSTHSVALAASGPRAGSSHSATFVVAASAVSSYARAVGETYHDGAPAPRMFAAVYAAPAVWPVVLEAAGGRRPILHLAQEFQWAGEVAVGDTITTSASAQGAEQRAGSEMLIVRSRSVNQHGMEVAAGAWTIMIGSPK